MNNSPELIQLIKDNKHFWWWVGEDNLEKLDLGSIVEGILNYGYGKDIKKLFEIVGIKKVSEIFFHDMKNKRTRGNYFPMARHYFDLYFKKHAS